MNTLASINSTTFSCRRQFTNPTISQPTPYSYFTSRQSIIACSSTGQYVSYCASGGIYTSSNHGHLFTPIQIPLSFFSICMSLSGQYQYVISSAIPEANIWSSTDFGVSFTRRFNVGTNSSRYIEKVICSSDGKNVFCLGAGSAGQQNFYSINHGTTFSTVHEPLTRTTGCFDGANILLYESYTNSMRTVNLDIIPPIETNTTNSPYGASVGNLINENSNILLLPFNHTSICTSSNFGFSWTNIQGTPNFKHAFIINSIFYACSTNIVYKSINQGVTWTVVYSLTGGNTIKGFTGISSKIFMVFTSGSIAILTL